MARTSPPRFVVRTTVATLIMVAGVLTAVFVGVAFDVRERVRGAVRDKLDAGQRMLSALEERRAQELSVQVATLAENPTLKAAVDTYQAEIGTANAGFRREMLATVDRELEKLAARISPDVLAVTDPSGVVLAVAGRRSADWPVQTESARARGRLRRRLRHDADGRLPVRGIAAVAPGNGNRLAAARQGPRRPLRARARQAVGRGDAHRVGQRGDCEHAAD